MKTVFIAYIASVAITHIQKDYYPRYEIEKCYSGKLDTVVAKNYHIAIICNETQPTPVLRYKNQFGEMEDVYGVCNYRLIDSVKNMGIID